MSVDKLQKRIRELKNPLMVSFSADTKQIPPKYWSVDSSYALDYERYAAELLRALQDTVPAVRFHFGTFATLGTEGLEVLCRLMDNAADLHYYVLLDAPECWSGRQAELVADNLMDDNNVWKFDGLLLTCYMGSDCIKPFVSCMKGNDKDLFVVLRTGNKSASEIQDLLTGTRFVHTAAADIASYLGQGMQARCGYSRVAGVGPATSAPVLQNLRSKYPSLFLLVDGLDYPGGNAKNCAQAFDRMGHGAIACVSSYVTGAWLETDTAGAEDPVACCVLAAERLRRNLSRYVTVL